MKIAIIPARGGSKRIPRKNIKAFCGKPMIAWSIQAARSAEVFDKIIVSTDDREISSVAELYGAEVPFIRPESLANDFAGTGEVVAHGVQWCIDQGWAVAEVCCIYATAPFVLPSDIVRGLNLLQSGPWAYSFTVTDFAAPIFRAFKQIPSGGLEMFYPEYFSTRSQDLPQALHDAGQFYWGTKDAWLENKRFFDAHSIPLVIPRWRVQDIDTTDDWERAEIMAKYMNGDVQ